MILLDKPYVSDFLRETLERGSLPVLDTAASRAALGECPCLTGQDEFLRRVREQDSPRLYSNSENAIDWIADNLGFTDIPERIRLFKDKVAFREMLRPMYPDYVFRGVPLDELDGVNPADFAKPFIVKPSVGFFSLGVHVVESDADWQPIVAAIHAEVDEIKSQYPAQVLGVDTFIIEESIPGEEFAVDVYWDADGEPVILNVLAHLFADATSVNDRVYVTSRAVVEPNLERFGKVLGEMGRLAGLRDFPGHVELRVDEDGNVGFIEGNPMRFAGWCVADLTWHAWGMNPYETYLKGEHPDWDAIFARRGDMVTSVTIADISADTAARIESVDYDAFTGRYTSPLELRRIDYTEYPVFAFLFAEHEPDKLGELDPILASDLSEFLTLRDS